MFFLLVSKPPMHSFSRGVDVTQIRDGPCVGGVRSYVRFKLVSPHAPSRASSQQWRAAAVCRYIAEGFFCGTGLSMIELEGRA